MKIDRRLLAFLRPYRLRLIAGLCLAAVSALGMGAYAFLAGPAARALVEGGSLDLGPMVEELLPPGLVERLAQSAVGALPALLIAVALVRAAASAGFNLLLHGTVAAAAADLRRVLFSRLLRADPTFFRDRPTGELISRFTGDVAVVESVGMQVMMTLSRDVSQAIALLVTAALIDPRWMLAAGVVMLGTWVPTRAFAKRIRAVGKEQLALQGQLSRRLEQVLRGHWVVQAYGAEAEERRRFARLHERFLQVMRRSLSLRGAYSPLVEGLGVIGLAVAVAWAGRAVLAGTLPPEAIVSFAAAALMLYQPLKALGNLGQQMAQLRAAAERAFEVVDAPEAVRDAPGARAIPPPKEIRLEGVKVRYGDKEVLRGVDLCLRRGETVALVGESGAGKSTIAHLLLRFLDPTEGSVRFDGVDIREVSLRSLRSSVGYVPQETVIFADSVRENILAGGGQDEAQLREAAKKAQIHERIEALPQGYDGDLAEGGATLSGGERQRIGIARALVRGARVLILDEATSALDAQNDALLQEAFAEALRDGDRIGLVISHRLSTLQGVDRVVVLEGGRVVEEGPLQELIEANGTFARMWRAA